MYAQVDASAFTRFDDFVFHLFLYFGNHFFNASRVNTSICHQLVQSQSANFATNRIEGADNDGLRGVVHHNFGSSCCFEGTDVAAFTADDTTFHFVGVDMEYADGVFNRCFAGYALNGLDDDFLGLFVGCHLGLVHDFVDVLLSLCLGLVFQRFDERFASLFCG